MKTKLYLATLTLAIAGCATVNYQPYEGNAVRPGGVGGTKLVVEGVDFWSNGTPPRPYVILGVVDGAYEHGGDATAAIRSKVAAEAKKRGGDAVILMSSTDQVTGGVLVASTVIATSTKAMRFAVVKYQ